MSEVDVAVVDDPTPDPAQAEVEKQAFLDRLSKEGAKRKDAEKAAAELRKQFETLKAQVEEREQAGLPELERERKRAEQLEKRAAEAEERATQAEKNVQRSQRERWITAAAQSQNFADPSDASAFVSLDDIEDEKDAERAVKDLAKRKAHLLKSEEPVLPGRVLSPDAKKPKAGEAPSQMDRDAEVVAEGLKEFLAQRRR